MYPVAKFFPSRHLIRCSKLKSYSGPKLRYWGLRSNHKPEAQAGRWVGVNNGPCRPALQHNFPNNKPDIEAHDTLFAE
ncbi:hypothetical protein E2C01_048845 [Portunus trituberculatus]|uniref:Uncharacterized protein n=1 Tax=Portunus trituberculatus TaxID=210409 RepID=A0A5B7GBL8_PORTR|nr:hypothetical protein [Portunus trituberculatus]